MCETTVRRAYLSCYWRQPCSTTEEVYTLCVQQVLQKLTKAVNGLFIYIRCLNGFNRERRAVYPNGKLWD